MLDVAIVGAGAAGIGAARTLRDGGASTALFEARDRPGGRAVTVELAPGVFFDRGAQYLHSADINPLTTMARELGFAVDDAPLSHRVWLGDRWADAAEEKQRLRAINRAFELPQEDVAVSERVRVPARWEPSFRRFYEAVEAVAPEEHSALDAVRYADTGVHYHVAPGLGAVVAAMAEGLDLRLSTPVSRIDWSTSIVRVETSRGIVEAGAVLVTVPVGAFDRLRFDPPLPLEKSAALAAINPGRANKAALRFPHPVLPEIPDGTLIAPADGRFGFQLRPSGYDFVQVYAAAENAADPDFARSALAELEVIAGRRLEPSAVEQTAWHLDPWIRGAYSTVRPGGGEARAVLRRPLEQRLYFAGEATSPAAYGTVHGAYESGVTAAHHILAR